MGQTRWGSTALGITVLGIAAVLLLALFSIRIVGVGEVGIISTFGVVDPRFRPPGLTLKAPWAGIGNHERTDSGNSRWDLSPRKPPYSPETP